MKRFIPIAVALVACGHDHPHGEEHGHGDEEEHGHGGHGDEDEITVAITRWTDELELFAEHPAVVVGQPVEMLAHITVLDGFRALEEGTATLVLEGPATITAVAEGARRPGIFVPEFTARAPGTYRGRLEVRAPNVEDTIDGFTIEVYPTAEASQAAAGEDPPNRISFLKEQQWRVPFDTAFVGERSLVPTIEVAGTVGTPPDGSAEVGSPVEGRLVLPPDGLVRPGQSVEAGHLLATVAPAPSAPEEGARAALAVAEADARLARARSDLDRAERLSAEQAISQRDLENARREVEVAQQAVGAANRARAIFSGGGVRGAGSYRLVAPIAGIVTDVHVSPGAAVTPDMTLFRIVDPSEIWIRAQVPEQEAARLRTDGDAAYSPSGSDAWHAMRLSGEGANASQVYVGRTVDPESRTVEVVYALTEPDPSLRVGGLVRVSLPVGEPVRAIAVPRSAIVDDDGRSVVYVQPEGEAFEERIVRLGPRAGAWVAVTENLRAGERVVTEGANLVRLASRSSSSAGHGHVH